MLELTLQRPEDFVGCYGGEEFVAVLPNCNRSGAEQVAERLRESIALLKIPRGSSGQYEQVTISIGVACRTMSNQDETTAVLHEADQALYRAKVERRNRVVID